MLIEALSQLLGAPAPPECVRAPATTAAVEGVVALAPGAAAAVAALGAELGLPARALPTATAAAASRSGSSSSSGDGWVRLVLRREITTLPIGSDSPSPPGADAATGAAASSDELLQQPQPRALRSRCFVNGAPTSLRVLRALGAALVDTNGQHAALGLRDPETQLALLDRVAGPPALALAAAVAAKRGRLSQIHAALSGLDDLADESERARVEKLVALVTKARVEAGEERALRARLRSMDARRAALEQAAALRAAVRGDGGSGGGGLMDGLRTVASQLSGLVAAEEAVEREEARAAARDAAEAADEDCDSTAGASAAAASKDGGEVAAGGGYAGREQEWQGQQEDTEEEGEEAEEGYSGGGDEDEEEREPTGLDHLEACAEALADARAALGAAAEALALYGQVSGLLRVYLSFCCCLPGALRLALSCSPDGFIF